MVLLRIATAAAAAAAMIWGAAETAPNTVLAQGAGNLLDQRPTFSGHSDMVVLHVAVQDRKGGFVKGLSRDAFTVYEDGQAQEIDLFESDEPPITVGLVVDNSGSMRGKRDDVAAAALAFAKSGNPQDEMFLVNFNESVRMGLPPGMPFASELSSFASALATIKAAGQTALYDAVVSALWHLRQGAQRKKVLIVVSDGGDNASSATEHDVLRVARGTDAVIYTVGIFTGDDNADAGVLKRLAQETGGARYLPKDPPKVVQTLEQIARDIRTAYTIGYAPINAKHDGTYRRLRVEVKAPGRGKLAVRARAGYVAPADQTSSTRIGELVN
jgi:VWFA-related protein